MTLPVSGGVPERGLREPEGTLNRRLKRIADEMPALRDFIRAEHGPIGWEHTLSIWVTDLQKIVAALERPRPAPEPPCSVCGGKPLASGRECVCGGRGTEYAEAQGLRERLADLEIALGFYPNVSPTISKAYAEVRAALPPQTGNPSPEATLAFEAAYLAAMQMSSGSQMSHLAVRDGLEAAYAVDGVRGNL